MLSFKSTVLAVAAAFVTIARAQEDYFIEPDSVPLSTRKAWCKDEKWTCPIICKQSDDRPVLENSCDPETLTYGCLCGDGKQPDMTLYTLTLPYFVCTEAGTQCVAACGQDNECSRVCREDNPCGAQDPSPPNSTRTGSAPKPTETEDEDQVFDGLDGDEGSGDEGASPAQFGRAYGLVAVMGSLFVGFAML